jgi:hypothetical protein
MDDHTVLWKATPEGDLCVSILLLPEDGYDRIPKHAGALFVIKILAQILDNQIVYKSINMYVYVYMHVCFCVLCSTNSYGFYIKYS